MRYFVRWAMVAYLAAFGGAAAFSQQKDIADWESWPTYVAVPGGHDVRYNEGKWETPRPTKAKRALVNLGSTVPTDSEAIRDASYLRVSGDADVVSSFLDKHTAEGVTHLSIQTDSLPKAAVAALARFSNLLWLELECEDVTVLEALSLKKYARQLSSVSISAWQISAKIVREVLAMPDLVEAQLHAAQSGAGGCLAGVDQLSIRRLVLGGFEFGQSDVVKLKSFVSLECLEVSSNQLSERDLYGVVNALPKLEWITIRRIDFNLVRLLNSRPGLRGVSAESLALSSSGKPESAPRLIAMSLKSVVIDSRSRQILDLCEDLESVSFTSITMADGSTLKLAEWVSMEALLSLELFGCKSVSLEGLAESDAPKLKAVSIVNAKLTGAFVQWLAAIQTLEYLCLTQTSGYSHSEMTELCRSPIIRVLKVNNVKIVDDEIMEVVAANMSALEAIDLSGCVKVTTEGVVSIVKGVESLQRLNTSHCWNVDEKEVARSIAVTKRFIRYEHE